MTDLELFQVIGYAQDEYILRADERKEAQKIIPFSRPLIRAVAAIFAVVLAIGLFLQTPVGAAAAEVVKEQIQRFLEILFPPKDMVVYVEGVPETIHVEAQGREPAVKTPGFSIYMDGETYAMTEENGSWLIRPLSADDDSAGLPPVEMEIRECPDLSPIAAAEKMREQMEKTWETVTVMWSFWLDGQKTGMTFHAYQGSDWDAAVEEHYFLDNSRGGCFHIVSRFYTEAAEGHGARFASMVETFSIVAPQDISQYTSTGDALRKGIQQEIAYAREQDAVLLERLDPANAQSDRTSSAVERSALWHETHSKLWTALSQTLDENTLTDLTYEHFLWATQRRELLDETQRKLGHTPTTTMTVYTLDGDLLEERTGVLLRYLEGRALPTKAPEGIRLSPNALVAEFTEAYFQGDSDTIRRYLTSDYKGLSVTYPYDASIIDIHLTKGMEDIYYTMTEQGYLSPAVVFHETPDSDTITNFVIHLVWEDDHWAVRYYGMQR